MISQRGRFAIAAAVSALSFGTAQAQQLYWDIDGTTAGAGGATPSGVWDNGTALDDAATPVAQTPTTNWNASADGTGAAVTWDQTNQLSDAVFSAGTNATGNFNVTIKAANKLFANTLTIEEGTVHFIQGSGTASSTSHVNFTPGSGIITVEENAGLSFVNQLTFIGFTTGTSHILLKNGAKMITTNTGAGGSFFNNQAPIRLAPSATVTLSAAAVGGSLFLAPITSNDTSTVTTLIKAGPGDFRTQLNSGQNTFTKLIVDSGMFRPGNALGVNYDENTLTDGGAGVFGAIPTALDPTNITLKNNGGLGNVNNVVLDDNRGIFLEATGGRLDVQNGQTTVRGPISGPGGLSLGYTNPAATGNATQIIAGTNTYGGATTIRQGNLTVLGGAAIPDTSAVSVVVGGTGTYGNFNVGATAGTPAVSETIGSLAGGNDTLGNVVITNSASVLTTGGNTAAANWAGRMTGAGALVKIGTGTQTLSGGVANARTGTTSVHGGILALNKTAGLDAIAGNLVTVGDGSATAATLRLDASDQIGNGANLVINGANAAFAMQGNSETVNTVTLESGAITGTGTLTPVTTFEMKSGSASAVLAGSGKALNKTTAGTVTLTGINTYTGGTNVQAGTLEVKNMHAGNAVDVDAGATLRILPSAPQGTDPQSGDNAFVSRPSALTVDAAGFLDITNNDIVLDYSGASPVAAYEALVKSAYNVTGDWQGPGITSSTAANDGNYVVAIADNATLAAPFGTAQGGPLFAGVDVDLDTILIKFTHRADINLDGLVTPDDSAVFGGNYDEGQAAVWATGDMNYDGIFTPDDAAIFGGAYDESLTALPEPGSLAALALLGLGLARRRRRA